MPAEAHSIKSSQFHLRQKPALTMPSLELFFSPGACSRVTLIALEEIGCPFTATPIMLSRGEHKKPDFLRVNPKGKVPALLVDGELLTENVAILTGLAQWFPDAQLLPSASTMEALQSLSMLAWFASGIHPYIPRLVITHVISDEPAAAPRIQAMAATMLGKQLDLLQQKLGEQSWILGQWSLIDAYAFWVWTRIQGAPIDLSRFTLLAAHADRMSARPSVQRALAREKAVA